MIILLTILFCLMMILAVIIKIFENERFWSWFISKFPNSFNKYEIDRNKINPRFHSFSDSALSIIIGAGKKFGKFNNLSFATVSEKNIHHKEILNVLLGLDDEKLDELLELYKRQFGNSAARYARKTYRKWESGKVKPITQTYERFLVHLPKVMDFDLKCEVLRHLMEEYCAKDNYDLTIYTDDWEKTLEPLVQKLIDKPYNSNLPKQIEDKLSWLAHDDMQIAEDILKKSQVEEGKIAVSMLRQEFAEIENLLENTKGSRKVSHQLKFPYGTINLEIKRR